MKSRAQWSYVQARLQARHGERLHDTDWRVLDSARSVDQFIDLARTTPLARFAERVNARMTSHVMEKVLRDAWRAYVAEVARLVPEEWRDAVAWGGTLPELPLIDAALRGKMPRHLDRDPFYADLLEDRHPLRAAFGEAGQHEAEIVEKWFAHWRSLWPASPRRRNDPLLELVAAIQAYFERLDTAGPQDTTARHRAALMQRLARLFRRNAGTPVAVFSHLALVALDLERLRGALVRRLLFEAVHAKDAA